MPHQGRQMAKLQWQAEACPTSWVIMDVTGRELERSILFLRTMAHRVPGSTAIGRSISLVLFLAAFAIAADPPIPPVTVCEILADLPAHEGKDVAVLGRYSFRDRKSTRLNSSHLVISYAVFC